MADGEEAEEGGCVESSSRVLEEAGVFERGGWRACSKAAAKNADAISVRRRKVKAC